MLAILGGALVVAQEPGPTGSCLGRRAGRVLSALKTTAAPNIHDKTCPGGAGQPHWPVAHRLAPPGPAGGQPQLSRTTNLVGSRTVRGSPRVAPAMRSSNSETDLAPSSRIGWRAVVSGGDEKRDSCMSSKPVMATSPGTATLTASAELRPTAIWSLATTTALGSWLLRRSPLAMSVPPASEKSSNTAGHDGAGRPAACIALRKPAYLAWLSGDSSGPAPPVLVAGCSAPAGWYCERLWTQALAVSLCALRTPSSTGANRVPSSLPSPGTPALERPGRPRFSSAASSSAGQGGEPVEGGERVEGGEPVQGGEPVRV